MSGRLKYEQLPERLQDRLSSARELVDRAKGMYLVVKELHPSAYGTWQKIHPGVSEVVLFDGGTVENMFFQEGEAVYCVTPEIGYATESELEQALGLTVEKRLITGKIVSVRIEGKSLEMKHKKTHNYPSGPTYTRKAEAPVLTNSKE